MEQSISFFPEESEIPKEFQITEQLEQKEYLINGELKIWSGDIQEVFSPIYIKHNSNFINKRLGSFPILGEKESFEALDAAKQAYDLGRGIWPTMPVKKELNTCSNSQS